MDQTSRYNHLSVDDFYFYALLDEEQIFPVSDEKYAEELQLQEALMSSAISSSRTRSSKEHFVEQKIIKTEPGESSQIFYPNYANAKPKNLIIQSSETEDHYVEHKRGIKPETDESSKIFCPICMDAKTSTEMFRINTCTHLFCSDCIVKHVAVKIQENISVVKCPDLNCKGVIKPELCRSIIPKLLFDRWEDALCESLILGTHKMYCPFQDCSAMLVDDVGERVTVSECPNCRRLFCAQCKVAWHAGIDCADFQRLGKDKRDGGKM